VSNLSLPFWTRTRWRLFVLVLLVVIPALVVQLVGAWQDLQQNLTDRKAVVAQIAAHAQGDFTVLMTQARSVFTDLVRLNEMRSPNNCTQIYSHLRLAYERLTPEATNLGLSDMQGNIYCAVNPVQGESNIADASYFQAALQTLDFSLGTYHPNPLTGAPVLNVAYPVLSFDGEIQTVIFATFEGHWLNAWQSEVTLPAGSALTLVTPQGEALYRTLDGVAGFDERYVVRSADWFAGLQAEEGVVEAPDLDGVRRLHSLIPLEYESRVAAYLQVGYPVQEVYAKAYESLGWKLALLVIALLAAFFLAWWTSERLFLQPLQKLMSAVDRVQGGDLSARVSQLKSLAELTTLARSFDTMTDALQQREAERQESEARFRAILDNTAVGVAVMTLDRHIVQINQTVTRITGYSAEEMFDFNPSLLVVEEDRYIDRELFADLIAGKRDQYIIEKRYLRKDGSIFWGRVNFALVRGEGGKPLYIIGIIEDITEEKRAAEKLAIQEAEYRRTLEQRIAERTDELNKANEMLQQKASQDAVAAERTRLARELHDAVTQTLFSATMIADVLPDLWEINMTEARRRLTELHQLTRGALAEMRSLLVELRPNALVEVPLPILLRQLTEAVTGRARVNVQLSVDGERKLPADAQVALYRIAQEALNNVGKHAKATQAMLTLRLGETVRLTVADNGAGFDPSSVTADHLGLKIMRERAEGIGAKFSVYSEPGEGTQISVVWE
jgi:PAS domain S-box-containing protein